MCVSIRAPAQDLIISSVYQRAKTLSRSTAARFEVNLHNGPMFALSVSVGTGESTREGCSFTVTCSGKWCPVSTWMWGWVTPSSTSEWKDAARMEMIPVWMHKEEDGCWMFLLQVQDAELRPAVSDGRGQSQRAAGLENRWVEKPLLITAVCFYLGIHVSACISCLCCLIRWLQSYWNESDCHSNR